MAVTGAKSIAHYKLLKWVDVHFWKGSIRNVYGMPDDGVIAIDRQGEGIHIRVNPAGDVEVVRYLSVKEVDEIVQGLEGEKE